MEEVEVKPKANEALQRFLLENKMVLTASIVKVQSKDTGMWFDSIVVRVDYLPEDK